MGKTEPLPMDPMRWVNGGTIVMQTGTFQKIDRIVKLGMLTALSLLMMLIRFPLFLPFLEYDMADVPILIGTFLFGPGWGVLLTLAVSVLQGVTVSAGSGVIGMIMHFIATGGFALTAGLIYRGMHSFKGALLSLGCGSLAMILLMIPLNLLLTPLYTGAPAEEVAKLLLPAIIPFNAVKALGYSLLRCCCIKAWAGFSSWRSLRRRGKPDGQRRP